MNTAAAKHTVRCIPRARGNMVAVVVDGREVDSAPGDGALVRLFRGVVAALREANPDADIELPGGLANEHDLIRDASILLA
jgi:hypothetical protein